MFKWCIVVQSIFLTRVIFTCLLVRLELADQTSPSPVHYFQGMRLLLKVFWSHRLTYWQKSTYFFSLFDEVRRN